MVRDSEVSNVSRFLSFCLSFPWEIYPVFLRRRFGLLCDLGRRCFSAVSLDPKGVGVGAKRLQSLDAGGRRPEVNAEANEGRSSGDQLGNRHLLTGPQHQRALKKRSGGREISGIKTI